MIFLSGVIFWDFDGTLVHSRHLWSNAVLASLRQTADTPYTLEHIRPLMRTGFPWHTPDRDLTAVVDGCWWTFLQGHFLRVYSQLGIGAETAQSASRKVRDYILDPKHYTLYDDTQSTLKRCRELGYRNYILSNNYPELWEMAEQLGLSRYFEGCFVSGKIGYDKPRRELFEYALQASGSPKSCLMVGDNPEADYDGAQRCGIPALLVHQEGLDSARKAVSALSQIPALLSQIH